MDATVDIQIAKGKDETEVQLTLRGSPAAIITVLVDGFPHSELMKVQDAFVAEIERRRVAAGSGRTAAAAARET